MRLLKNMYTDLTGITIFMMFLLTPERWAEVGFLNLVMIGGQL